MKGLAVRSSKACKLQSILGQVTDQNYTAITTLIVTCSIPNFGGHHNIGRWYFRRHCANRNIVYRSCCFWCGSRCCSERRCNHTCCWWRCFGCRYFRCRCRCHRCLNGCFCCRWGYFTRCCYCSSVYLAHIRVLMIVTISSSSPLSWITSRITLVKNCNTVSRVILVATLPVLKTVQQKEGLSNNIFHSMQLSRTSSKL